MENLVFRRLSRVGFLNNSLFFPLLFSFRIFKLHTKGLVEVIPMICPRKVNAVSVVPRMVVHAHLQHWFCIYLHFLFFSTDCNSFLSILCFFVADHHYCNIYLVCVGVYSVLHCH